MFTALVLICLESADVEPQSCYYMASPVFSETEDQCQQSILDFVNEFQNTVNRNPGEGEIWVPVDFRCVNWISIEI